MAIRKRGSGLEKRKAEVVVEVKRPRTYVVKEQGSDRRIHVHADDMVSSQVRQEANANQTPEFVDTCTKPAAPSEERRKHYRQPQMHF